MASMPGRFAEGFGSCVSLRRYICLSLATVVTVAVPGRGASPESTKGEAERLVTAAAQAEIGGDITKSVELLQNAVRNDRDNRLAHWQLGEVQVNKKWVKVEDAQSRAATDRQQAEYQTLRAAAGETAERQLALAKWCRKNILLDEARYHWANVLAVDPNNADAMRALDVRWYRGRLLPTAEIASLKKTENVRQREQLTASVAKWRKAFDGKKGASLEDALAEIRAVQSAEAIPVIEDLTVNPESASLRPNKNATLTNEQIELRHRVGKSYLASIAKMPEQAATEALVRQSVWSCFSDIREDSANELKKRPMYDYVPILLAGLELPIETSYQVQTQSDGSIQYVHTLYQPGAMADQSEVYSSVARPFFTRPQFDRDGKPIPDPTREQRAMQRGRGELMQFGMQAQIVEANVATRNDVTADRNQRIVAALTKTTDQNLGEDPRGWWTYWKDHNEYYTPPKQPVYQQVHVQNQTYFCCSCFVKGTPIWTKTGKRPVETLEVGDLVLSQNVDTGELRYEPVIGRTVRPPSPILKVSMDNGEIQATKGHPFWVAGLGWRMTKELEDGAVLCGLKQAARVRSIEPAGEAEAYNLIVAENNTYFVGDNAVLVHDNTPRRPTKATVPGVVAKTSAGG